MDQVDLEFKREIAALSAQQTHCYTCGRRLGAIRYKCRTCSELSCSAECRENGMKIGRLAIAIPIEAVHIDREADAVYITLADLREAFARDAAKK